MWTLLKNFVQRYVKLTYVKYRQMFFDAVKEESESYVNMSTRLSLNLGYYLESCKVTDFKGLVH